MAEKPGKKLTPKMEAFAQAYITEKNQSDAYRLAYNAENMSDPTIWNKASDLMKRGGVRVRIEELQEEGRKKHEITVEKLTVYLETGLKIAFKKKSEASIAPLTMAIAKLHGLDINRHDHKSSDGSMTPTPHGMPDWHDTRKLQDKMRKETNKRLVKVGILPPTEDVE